MSDDLDDVRSELAQWVEANELEAIRAELIRRGVEVEPSEVDEEFKAMVAEVRRRLLAAESDPMKAVAAAIAAIAAAVSEMAASVAALHRPPGAVIKTIERDGEGNIARVLEEPA